MKYYVKLSPRQKGRGTRVKGLYRSDECMQNYHALVRGIPITASPIGKDSKGSLKWLITQYRNSRSWCDELSAGTRKHRGPFLKHLEDKNGDIPYARSTVPKLKKA